MALGKVRLAMLDMPLACNLCSPLRQYVFELGKMALEFADGGAWDNSTVDDTSEDVLLNCPHGFPRCCSRPTPVRVGRLSLVLLVVGAVPLLTTDAVASAAHSVQ